MYISYIDSVGYIDSIGWVGHTVWADSAGYVHWDSIDGIPASLLDGDQLGFQKLKVDGSVWLSDSAIFVEGDGIALTQTGSGIEIAAEVGGDADWFVLGSNLYSMVTGNVGIGDLTPDHKLDVAGNIGLGLYSYINFGDEDGSAGYGFRDNSGTLQFRNFSGEWTDFGSGSGSDTDWQISGDDMYSLPSGKVGIGITSPGSKLHVNSGGTGTSIYGQYDSNIYGFLGSSSYGVYGRFNSTNYGYLGANDRGVYGAGFPYGIYGYATGIGSWAGYFQGNVNITGDLSVTGSYPGGQWVDYPTYIEAADCGGVRIYKTSAAKPGKIDANYVDPVIQIKGKQYSTWMAEAVGLRVDVVGEARLSNGFFEVDLAQQAEASDLWLFYHAVAENSIIPFVCPQDMANLICSMEGSVFQVRLHSGDAESRFSYRLSGKRIDEAASPPEEINRRADEYKAKAFIDADSFDKNGNPK